MHAGGSRVSLDTRYARLDNQTLRAASQTVADVVTGAMKRIAVEQPLH